MARVIGRGLLLGDSWAWVGAGVVSFLPPLFLFLLFLLPPTPAPAPSHASPSLSAADLHFQRDHVGW